MQGIGKGVCQELTTLQTLPHPASNAHPCTSGHESPRWPKCSSLGEDILLLLAALHQDLTPLLGLEPFGGGVGSFGGWDGGPG